MIQRSAFPVSLVFPPQGHFTQPYLALPCLKAWLVASGFPDVELVDASLEAYDRFLSRPYLEEARGRAARRVPLGDFDGLERLPFARLEAFRAAAESAVSAGALIEEVDAAKEVVRGEAFYDPDRYVPAIRTLYHALRLVSAAWFPSELTPHNFTMGYSIDRSAEVLAATRDRDQNPFLAFFEEHLLPRLVARRPRLLGMSVIYGSQLVPALTLGRLVKERLPECHVTAGGGFLAYIGRKLMAAPGMDACLDSLVFWEGERPLAELARALEAGERDLAGVGSLAWFDRSRLADGRPRAVLNAPAHPIELDAAPVPDFDGLPLERYFSPRVVFPYDVNRGCYYGECTFCTLPTVIGPGYRTRRAETIADHVVRLRDRHGVRAFNFITDCMPPGMIRDLPEALLARDAGVHWWSDARVEPRAYTVEGARRLYEAGCRKLLFGFETATPRLLKLMQKGQSARATLEVARNCDEAGISVTFYAMVGFPSETREEARATLAFLLDNADVVREVSLQTFHIDEVAQTYREPERFGITILDDPDADLQLYHDYEAAVGMTQDEAAAMFEEMMAGFRERLPIFSGDNVFYFMQKSHYFLHLAGGTTPDAFAATCRARARSEAPAAVERLRPAPRLATVALSFAYVEAVRTLAHPLARAVRPDFLTGRFDGDVRRRAEAELSALRRRPRVLARAGGGSDFAELSEDGADVLARIERAGSVGALAAGQAPEDVAALFAFAAELGRLGLLVPGDPAGTLVPRPPAAARARPPRAEAPQPPAGRRATPPIPATERTGVRSGAIDPETRS